MTRALTTMATERPAITSVPATSIGRRRMKVAAARSSDGSWGASSLRKSRSDRARASRTSFPPFGFHCGPLRRRAGRQASKARRGAWLGPVERQADEDFRARADNALDGHLATLQRCKPLHDGQAEAGAFEGPIIGGACLKESLSKPRQIVSRDADAGVA